jgi:type II secretory pathway component PulF
LKTLPEIEQGGSLTSAFMRIRVFPSTVIEMLSAGEHSGKIGDMLEKIAEHYETEYETIVKRLVIILPLFIYMLVMLYIAYVIISFWMGYFQQMGGIL